MRHLEIESGPHLHLDGYDDGFSSYWKTESDLSTVLEIADELLEPEPTLL